MILDVSPERIAEFCQRWRVNEFALFGSVLRDDFSPESDVDVLVSFEPPSPWSLFDHVEMQDELTQIFGRRVDLVSRKGVEHSANPLRKRAILDSARVVYAAT